MPTRISTRFLSGSLSAIAIASAVTLATPAYAADEPCGQPAVEAVYQPLTHDAVYRTVPAQTHDEWLWERDVDTYEYEYSAVLSPERTETDWTRTLTDPDQHRYQRTVIDRAATPATPDTPEVGHFETVVVTPAVTETQYKFVHNKNGNVHWGPADFGGNGNSPWVGTGETRTVVITAAVTAERWVIDTPAKPGSPGTPEESHTESQWSATDPGGDWVRTADTRAGASTTENKTTSGDAPDGAGWTLVASRVIAAVIDTQWATEAPQGYSPTGSSRVASTKHFVTDSTSATAPEGDGWTEVPASKVTIEDSPETTEVETAGWIEQVLITPARPATEDCVVPPGGDGGPVDPGTQTVAPPVAPAEVQDEVQDDVPAEEPTEEKESTTDAVETTDTVEAQAEIVEPQDAVENGTVTEALPQTLDAPSASTSSPAVPAWAWLASIGAGAVLAGAGALRFRRRRGLSD